MTYSKELIKYLSFILEGQNMRVWEGWGYLMSGTFFPCSGLRIEPVLLVWRGATILQHPERQAADRSEVGTQMEGVHTTDLCCFGRATVLPTKASCHFICFSIPVRDCWYSLVNWCLASSSALNVHWRGINSLVPSLPLFCYFLINMRVLSTAQQVRSGQVNASSYKWFVRALLLWLTRSNALHHLTLLHALC